MTPRRSHDRIQLNVPVTVIDALEGTVLGELINITSEGLMIYGCTPVAPHTLLQIRLIPPPESHHTPLDMGVDCLWHQAAGTHRHWIGCRILDATSETLQQLAVLIAQYGAQIHLAQEDHPPANTPT